MMNLLRFLRPLFILLTALAFGMGAALAKYLGNPLNPVTFWPGLLAVMLAQAGMSLLAEVFRPVTDPLVEEETIAARRSLHNILLYASEASLAVFSVLVFLVYISEGLAPLAVLFFLLELALVFLYAVPPVRLVRRGFGEVIQAVHIGYIVPSLGFLLQAGEYHRLLGMIAFPLMLLALACFIALDFPTYAADRKYNRGSLLAMLGWERAVPLHNLLLAAAYLILLAAPLFDIPLVLIWPVFLTLPFALVQVLLLRGISQGARPIWLLLRATAIAIVGLAAYFLTLTFWLR